MLITLRTKSPARSFTFTPSSKISPLETLYRPPRSEEIVLLPDPDPPTIPIFSPGWATISNVNLAFPSPTDVIQNLMIGFLRIGEAHVAKHDLPAELVRIGDRVVRGFVLFAVEAVDSAGRRRRPQRGRRELENALRRAQRLHRTDCPQRLP